MHGARKTVFLLVGCLTVAAAAAATDVAAERQKILQQVERLVDTPDGLSESAKLEEFIDLNFDYAMLEFPEFATYIGHPGDHDRWSDNSLAAQARREAEQRRGLEILHTFDREQLTGEDRLNYDLLVHSFEEDVAGQKFLDEYLPLNQMNGVHSNVAQMFAIMPQRTVADYENILGRLRGAATLVANDLERLRLGLEKGVTPPKITLRDVPAQFDALLTEDPMASPLLAPFQNVPDTIPEAERQRLADEAVAVFSDSLAPALRTMRDFVVDEYIPGARESIATRDLPDGAEWYAYNARQATTTDLTPEQIHQIGLSEVARIRTEMDQVIADSGFEGSFEDFTTFLRQDPQFYFHTADELLTAYRDIAKRADAKLVGLFGTLPRLPYGVEPVPDYMAPSQTTAYYQPGSLEAGRPGTYFANTYKLETRPKWEMEALSLHESVPGHHLQISLQQELDDLPWFRRFGGYTAFVEGWGLYAESLGEEMVFYQDPYSKFGQLTYEMWRAVRLVVDTGMHYLGWSRQQAIDYFVANTGKQEHDIVVEVDRYIVWPGQALAYKIGELKIKELRAYAESELGDAFDIRAFHDVVLGNGALPLDVLEIQVHEWVDGLKAAMAKT
jgi:uncharacterized protein (DUF885 family)